MKSRTRFGKTLQERSGKVDNHPAALAAKVEIRKRVLDAIGADNAAVFDAFAGEGTLHKRVWHRAKSYIGCDLIWYRDQRVAYVADSRRVMRAIDLSVFNCFDLDAHGSPWEHALILIARRPTRPGERIGLVLTEGSSLKVRLGGLPHALAQLAQLRPKVRGGSRAFDDIIDRAIAGTARRMGCRVVKRWQAKGKTGSGMRYIGLVLENAAVSLNSAPTSAAAV